MKRKLILSLFYMGLIAALVSIIATVFVYQNTMRDEVRDNLREELRLLKISYPKLQTANELMDYNADDLRITLIDSNGTVLFESDTDAKKMGNHLDRPEIISAIENGSGSAHRLSSTLGVEDYYYAEKLGDGNILRVSTRIKSVFSVFGHSFYILVAIVLGIAVVSVIISVQTTERILKPIKALSKSIDSPALYEKETYPELVPLIEEIKYQRNLQSDMRQEFTANVSHELKTPLTAISGYAEMIENDIAKGDDIKRFAGKIRTESTRMLTLIGDIIKLSKLDSDTASEVSDTVDLKKTAEECRDSLAVACKDKDIMITIIGEADPIKGNQTELYELVYNLMDNAVKYNRQGGNIDVILSGKTIRISDTGIGIPEKDKHRIFERFYRVDKSRSKATGGTGLGLSIVKHVAEKHNATITVESTLNVGTDITVDFNGAKA
ncbi:ATP-binding protein [Ruminococcus sp.]|uniref:sensor histidine kinase n=1 Tax=Ruminococcus sp. TaxID=41978 RepID=UPI00389041EC